MTSDLAKRIWQHKNGYIEGFTNQYSVKKLVYYEVHQSAESAIIREKQIKKWRRKWKLRLIEENNPCWKGGVTNIRQGRQYEAEISQWRRRVFARDNYTCQQCGIKPRASGQLNAHHIKSWKDYPNLRFEVSNGRTLCRKCHKEIHRNGGS